MKPFDERLLDERLAIVGTTGSGKSYAARGMVERVLDSGTRVGIIDPTGVWRGIRVKADGSPGYPVVIFGGDGADLPLTATAGSIIAHAVANTQQSWIVDTSAQGTKAGERRFMLDFLDSLYEHVSSKIVLVVDEADRFSPQRMSPEVARLHERMEEIVRRGRVRGFIPWLLTQRPASLNKDVLSQASALIAMKLTGTHDRNAIAAVIEGQADRQEARGIVNQLPSRQRGQGIVWAPALGILESVTFPRIKTMDTMSAPSHVGHTAAPLPAIDLGGLRERLSTVTVEQEANDPAKLRTEIKRLERDLKKAQAEPSTDLLASEYSKGFNRGRDYATTAIKHSLDALDLNTPEGFVRTELPSSTVIGKQPQAIHVGPETYRKAVSLGEAMPKGDRAVLTVLAQNAPAAVDARRAAAIAGYSIRSSTWRGIMARLRKAGYVDDGPSPHRITAAGQAALGSFEPLPIGAELREHWMARVAKGDRETLRILGTIGECASSSLAERAGYSSSSSTWRGVLARLRALGLIEGKRTIKLHEDLR